jgi:pimeloyl-ACP methyl ester carboxylesterase
MAEETRDALTNTQVEYVVVTKCGHFWHECPDAFYPRVRAFLDVPPVLAQESSHYLHEDAPDVVLDAIRQMVERARE